jgi:non-heme chloroperoxidase
MRIAVEGERSLYVERHGPRAAPTALLVHGGGCNRRVWDTVVPALLADGRSVVTLDLRACGWSDQDFDAMGIPELGRDVVRVIEALGLGSVDLVGWSLGGAVVVEAALLLGPQLRRLVVVGGATPRFLYDDDYAIGMPAEGLALIRQGLADDRAAFYRGLVGLLFHQDRPDLRAWCFDIFMSSGVRHDESIASLADVDHRTALKAIDAPTLVCHGRHDQFVALAHGEALVAGLPDARLRVFEESGHAPFLEEPAAFRAELLAFLNEG